MSALRLVAFRGWKYGFAYGKMHEFPNALISPRGTVFEFRPDLMVARLAENRLVKES